VRRSVDRTAVTEGRRKSMMQFLSGFGLVLCLLGIVVTGFAQSLEEAQPAVGTVLLSDDFSDPARGWLPRALPPLWAYQGAYESGEYRVWSTEGLTRAAWVPVSGTYADSALAIDVWLGAETHLGEVHLGCRVSARPATGYVLVIAPERRTWLLVREDPVGQVVLVEPTPSEAIERGEGSNRVAFLCVGDRLTAQVNRVVLGTVIDGTYARGTWWVGPYGVGPLEARFDNLVVTQE
jgi:hypothetical protein